MLDSSNCHPPSKRLGGLSENTDKRAAHSFLISESGFARDHFNRMSALRDHQARGFEPEAFDRLRGRRARLGPERPAELTRTEARGFRQIFDRKRRAEIAPGVGECVLDAVGFRVHVQQSRMLGLSSGALLIDDEYASHRARELRPVVCLQHVKCEVDPRMASETRSSTGAAEMAAAKTLTTKVLAIGSWTAKATPETRPAIMPSEARDTLRLQLAGKLDQWFAKSDGSGAVFLMNVTDPAEAHKLLEDLPLGRAGMMTFELIPMGPLWPLGLLLPEPLK
jgi:hypothetical protein